jgi:hypothetical protein
MNIFEFLAPLEVENIIFEFLKRSTTLRPGRKNLQIYGMYFNS